MMQVKIGEAPQAYADTVEWLAITAEKSDLRRRVAMYMDVVVFAGIGTVMLMVGFMSAVGWFVARDARNRTGDRPKPGGH